MAAAGPRTTVTTAHTTAQGPRAVLVRLVLMPMIPALGRYPYDAGRRRTTTVGAAPLEGL
ncbi:hypothetical protein [Streptomyces aureus]|uniref:hypothetical protein n=1 Tax=Streptomyces aureus TaxID=193461 RepID=UPI003690D52C